MQHPKNLRIADFSYTLPEERIAAFPAAKRDESKLLVYENGEINEDVYKNIAEHLAQDGLMVFNQTKVVPARLFFTKETGSKIEIFCLEPETATRAVADAMYDRTQCVWRCMVGGAGKWKAGVVLHKTLSDGTSLNAEMVSAESGTYLIRFSWTAQELTFAEILELAGEVPLPPYFKRKADKEDAARYQTVFAKDEGSVAAPTAGLHFTDRIFTALSGKGIEQGFLSLHVGAGTFKPVKAEAMDDHEMHAEWMDVSADLINALLQHAGNITAVGTTALRSLESLYWIGVKLLNGMSFADVAVTQWEPYELPQNESLQASLKAVLRHLEQNNTTRLITKTQILIAPPYQVRVVNSLVTNFHQPNSTLLLLVAALVGDDWRKIYDYALSHDFRFLSYGDGCLLRLG